MLCNILNIPLDLPQTEQGPGMGGAMLAMVGAGIYPDVVTCAKALVSVKETVYPDPELAEKYEAKYQKFRKIYPSVKNLYKEIK